MANIQQIYSLVTSNFRIAQNVDKFDITFLDPTDFKANDLGNLTNNWIRITNKDIKDLNFAQKTSLTLKETFTESTDIGYGDYSKNLVEEKFIDVLLFNVSLDIRKSPTLVTTDIKNIGIVTQKLNSGNYIITVSGTLFSPYFWQSDIRAIKDLDLLLESNRQLMIQSPEINKVYGINKIVINDLTITNNKYPNLRDFTLTLTEDKNLSFFKIKNR